MLAAEIFAVAQQFIAYAENKECRKVILTILFFFMNSFGPLEWYSQKNSKQEKWLHSLSERFSVDTAHNLSAQKQAVFNILATTRHIKTWLQLS